MPGRRLRLPSVPAAGALAVLLACGPSAAASAVTASASASALPAVVAVFPSPASTRHGCSGAVVATPGGPVVVTAAHCVVGRGTGLRVVPGYDRGRRPFGTWAVAGVYVDRGWQATADPRRDLAVLRLAPQVVDGRRRTLGSVVRGYALGQAPAPGTTTRVYGYRAGAGDRPVGCVDRTASTAGYPTFPCGGMTGGVSGSPFLTAAGGATVLRGVVGGLHEGGCRAEISYSSPFGGWSSALVARAARGGTPDVVRTPRGSGC